MAPSFFAIFSAFLLVLFSIDSHTSSTSIPIQQSFLQCMSSLNTTLSIPLSIPLSLFYTSDNSSSFNSVLQSSAQNLRYLVPTVPKPEFIFTPLTEPMCKSLLLARTDLESTSGSGVGPRLRGKARHGCRWEPPQENYTSGSPRRVVSMASQPAYGQAWASAGTSLGARMGR
ncbi:hypothetical protein NL676_012375 [Syzygium grande]|nr:hypothetical protein NL676_012375 [Syzygium grande]